MKLGIIGHGMVADTHVKAIAASDQDLEVSGVLGRSRARAAAYTSRIEADLGYRPRVYQSIEDLCADTTLDFALLLTPPDARMSYVEALTSASLPILMEKPVERSFEAAKAIVEMGETHNLPFGVVFQHRAREASRALAKHLAQGTLGDIATVDIRVPWWRAQSYYDAPGRGTYARDGGGVLINQAIHTLDLALCFLGPVQSVQALLATTPLHDMQAEDFAAGLLTFQSGAVGTLSASTAAFPGHPESIALHGTKGAAHLASGVLDISLHDSRKITHGQKSSTGGGADPMAFTHAWHKSLIEDFALSLQEQRAPMAPAREALRAHALIHALEKAAQTQTKVAVTNV
ncbi:MAG: Gfo/Idh/MocA family oxidoreductase [Pseudomonadota bacterium]